VVIRCRSCHLQSFHSLSVIPFQRGGTTSLLSSIFSSALNVGNNKSCKAPPVCFRGIDKLESEAGSIFSPSCVPAERVSLGIGHSSSENKKGDIIRYLLQQKGNALLPESQVCTLASFFVDVE
jgi:hypothetical protein